MRRKPRLLLLINFVDVDGEKRVAGLGFIKP
ncbi:MAG: hypothetical protein G01um101433_525 [Parcubacteria group bacterium Gr01-1014_33]|nr:MAG: hypothetical protein G01um101433_525 [Parcubacteria group bacterium Gr01-1014_33]